MHAFISATLKMYMQMNLDAAFKELTKRLIVSFEINLATVMQ